MTLPQKPVPLFILSALLGALCWAAGLHLGEAPAMDLTLRLEAGRLQLSDGQARRWEAPRPAGASRLTLRFFKDGIRFQAGRQGLAHAQRLQPAPAVLQPQDLGGGEWLLDAAAAPQAVYHLRIDKPEDLNLSLLDARDNGVSLVLRPLGNEQGWCRRVEGRYGLFESFGPLEALAPRAAVALAAEALAWTGAALLCTALLLGLALLLGARPAGPPRLGRAPRGAWMLAVGLGFALACASLLLGGDGLPHVTDEISNLFQARIFASGRGAAPAPPQAAAFAMEHIVAGAQGWHSKYPPFWPALLAPFTGLGWAWMAGPFYAALGVLLAYGWAREAAGRVEALALAGLLALSPQFVWLAGSYFNHAPALAASLALLWGGWRARERGLRDGWILAAAGAAALAAMRPYTAACLGAALGLWALGDGGWRKRGVWLGLGATALAMLWAVLQSNALSTGSPWVSPYTLYDPLDRPGFGPGLGSLPTWGSFGHDPVKAVASLAQDLRDLRWRLLGWPLGLSGGLLLLAVATLRWDRLERLLALAFGALVLGHMGYWAAILLNLGTCYWYEGLACALWLALRALGRLAERLQALGLPRARAAAGLLLVLGALASAARVLPEQAWALRGFAKVDNTLALTSAPLGPALRGLVFVPVVEPFDYNSAFALNSPFLDGRLVFARSRGRQADAALAAYYPSRRPLLLERGVLQPYALGRR